jgi:hypothetical protein
VISTGTSPTVKEKPIAIFDCHVRSWEFNTQLKYTVICDGSEFTDYPMFWQLLAFNGNLTRYYTFREREKLQKNCRFFFPPGHIVISYNLYHHGLITLFRIFWWVLKFFFLKTDEIYENIWEPISNAIYVALDSNWTI